MREKVIEIVSAITGLDTDELQRTICDPRSWDSVTHIEIILTLEDELDFKFSEEELGRMDTLGSIIHILEKSTRH